MRASSGMIGTKRGPSSGSLSSSLSRRTNAIVVATSCLPEPRRRTSSALSSGALSVLELRPPARYGATELPAPLEHVLQLVGVRVGLVVGRQGLVQRRVGDVQVEPVAEGGEVLGGQLLHLVRGVAALEVAAQRPALDGLGEDDRRLALVLHRRLVGRVDLAVVVAAAGEVPDLLVAHALDHLAGARVTAEEVLADEGAVLGLVGLVVAVRRLVHQVDQGAVAVGGQQRVPARGPRSP